MPEPVPAYGHTSLSFQHKSRFNLWLKNSSVVDLPGSNLESRQDMAKEKKTKKEKSNQIARNRKAFHNYEVMQHLACGMVLTGTEVKSLRDNQVNFADAYAAVHDGELLLIGLNIAEYAMGNRLNHEPARTRKLLARKSEIRKLKTAIQEKGMTLVPLSLFWQRGFAKVDIGIVRGKHQYDKRESIKDRDQKRDKQRVLRSYKG